MNKKYISILNKELDENLLTSEDIDKLASSNRIKEILDETFIDVKEIKQTELDSLTDNYAVLTLIQDYIDKSGIMIIDDYKTNAKLSGIGAYFNLIRKYPLLTIEEEHDLAMKFYQKENKAAKEKFYTSNLRLVVHIAKRCHKTSIDIEDLISEGNIGLKIAVDKFDPTKGVRFSSYASFWIKEAISRTNAKNGVNFRYPVHLYERMQKIMHFKRRYLAKFNKEPSDEIIMSECNVNAYVLKYYNQSLITSTSLDQIIENEENLGTEFDDIFVDSKVDAIESATKSIIFHDLDRIMKETLNDREYNIVMKRMGFDDEPQTFEQIAAQIGLSHQRVGKIEIKALKKLKENTEMQSYSNYL